MSLINDMLQDLSTRQHPDHAVKVPAYDALPRAAPLPRASGLEPRLWLRPSLWLNGVLSLTVLGMATGWLLQHDPKVAAPAASSVDVKSGAPSMVSSDAGMKPFSAAQPAAQYEPPSEANTAHSPLATTPTAVPPPATNANAIATLVAPESGTARAVTAAPAALAVSAPSSASRGERVEAKEAAVKSAATPSKPTPAAVAPTPLHAAAKVDQPSLAPAPKTAKGANQGGPPSPAPSVAPQGAAAARVPPAQAPVLPKESPNDRAQRMYQQALAEKKQGDGTAAMQSFRAVLELMPQHAPARLALASLLVDTKRESAAADLLAEGLMLLPQQTGFVLALSPLWIQAGRSDDAMALLAQSEKFATNDPPFHAYYAAQLMRLKRPAEAAVQYRLALKGTPDQGEWLLGLGLSLQASGNARDALDAFRKASEGGQLPKASKDLVDQVIAKLQQQVR